VTSAPSGERPSPVRNPLPVDRPAIGRGTAAPITTEKALTFWASAIRLFQRLLGRQRPLVAGLLGIGIVGVALTVLGPRLLGQATDSVFAGVIGKQLPAGVSKDEVIAGLRLRGDNDRADMIASMDLVPGRGIDFAHLGSVLMVVLGLYLASALFSLLQGRLTATVVQRAIRRLREDVEAKLARLPLSYLDRQARGEVLSRVTNDIDNVAQSMQQTLSQLVTAVFSLLGVLAFMLVISPLLTLVALALVPPMLVISGKIGKRARPHFVNQWSTMGKLNAHIEEIYTGHSLVKLFHRQHEAIEQFGEHNETLYRASFRAQFISGLIQPAMTFLGNVNYVLIAVIGALRVSSGGLSLGELQAFILYSRQFTQPITQVATMANLLQSAVASAERVFALLDADEQLPDPMTPVRLAQVRGRVAFENVSFEYLPGAPLIENLSFTAEPGQTVAIVGPTGAGKTTLVNLLMRFYEIDSGRITVDGIDIATMTRADLRTRTGMVLQDSWLFDGTIAENIGYGSLDSSFEQIVAAARATHVDHFVRTLPSGYDTVLDGESSSASDGERQLITVARAFLAQPAILILDEATSSVDTRTEVLIRRAMTSLRAGRTCFVIAHRLSTIRDADLILVMDSGRIVEQGTHNTLVDADGMYARLYAAQFAEPLG
jgi:ATP-binding cassette subfamily B multidrug efflux pump